MLFPQLYIFIIRLSQTPCSCCFPWPQLTAVLTGICSSGANEAHSLGRSGFVHIYDCPIFSKKLKAFSALLGATFSFLGYKFKSTKQEARKAEERIPTPVLAASHENVPYQCYQYLQVQGHQSSNMRITAAKQEMWKILSKRVWKTLCQELQGKVTEMQQQVNSTMVVKAMCNRDMSQLLLTPWKETMMPPKTQQGCRLYLGLLSLPHLETSNVDKNCF